MIVRCVSCVRAALVLLVIALVPGCSGGPTGPSLETALRTAGAPKAGTARVVVFRANKYAGLIDPGWPVLLDGKPLGELKNATFAYLDCPPGRHQLSVDMGMAFPGTPVSRHDFQAAPGRTYYFMAAINEKGEGLSTISAFAGLAGYAVATAATSGDGRGPVDFAPVDERDAQPLLASSSMAERGAVEPDAAERPRKPKAP